MMRQLIFIISFFFIVCKNTKNNILKKNISFVEKSIGKKLKTEILEIKTKDYLVEYIYKAIQILNSKIYNKAQFFDNNRSIARICSTIGRQVIQKAVLYDEYDPKVIKTITDIKIDLENELLNKYLNWPYIIKKCHEIIRETKKIGSYVYSLVRKYLLMAIERYKNINTDSLKEKFQTLDYTKFQILNLKENARNNVIKVIKKIKSLPSQYKNKFFIFKDKIKNCLFQSPSNWIRIRTYCLWLQNRIKSYKNEKNLTLIDKLIHNTIHSIDEFIYINKLKKICLKKKVELARKAHREILELIDNNPGKIFKYFDIGLGTQTRIIIADLNSNLQRIMKTVKSESNKNSYPENWNIFYWYIIYTELKDALEMRGMMICSKKNKFKILLINVLKATREYLKLFYNHQHIVI